MKKIVSVDQNSNTINLALLVARIGLATFMLTHGLPKMATLFSGGPIQFPSVMGLTPEVSLALTVFAEVFCSILILVGAGTRLAAIPVIITMLVAALVIHGADPFAKKEMALLYLLGSIVILIAGSGKYSVDYLLQQKLFAPSPVRISKLR